MCCYSLWMLCEPCGRASISGWRGWPDKDPVPPIPELRYGHCPVCGGVAELDPAHVMFVNVHGSSLGLPKYFALCVVRPGESGWDFYPKWGLPYVTGPHRNDGVHE